MMLCNDDLAIIVLAGGASTRLGQPKQLVKVKGETLIYRQCKLALSFTPNVFCVLGHQAEVIGKEIAGLPVNIVENLDWQQGLSSSIRHGIQQLPSKVNAAMLMLVDQWKVSTLDIAKVIEAYNQHPNKILLSQYKADDKTSFGPPVIFPKRFFTNLIGLSGEQGAKPILQKYKTDTNIITVTNALEDLDTPEQLSALQASLNE